MNRELRFHIFVAGLLFISARPQGNKRPVLHPLCFFKQPVTNKISQYGYN